MRNTWALKKYIFLGPSQTHWTRLIFRSISLGKVPLLIDVRHYWLKAPWGRKLCLIYCVPSTWHTVSTQSADWLCLLPIYLTFFHVWNPDPIAIMNTYTGTGKGKTGLSPLSLAAAAAAAKSLQSCPTLCDPIDGSPIPGVLQARTLEWVAISFSNAWKWKVKVKSLSVSNSQWPHGLQPTRFLHPQDFPGKSTGVGCRCLLRLVASKASHSVRALNIGLCACKALVVY